MSKQERMKIAREKALKKFNKKYEDFIDPYWWPAERIDRWQKLTKKEKEIYQKRLSKTNQMFCFKCGKLETFESFEFDKDKNKYKVFCKDCLLRFPKTFVGKHSALGSGKNYNSNRKK